MDSTTVRAEPLPRPLTPVVDRTYPLADTAEGLRYLEQGHARVKAVVAVA